MAISYFLILLASLWTSRCRDSQGFTCTALTWYGDGTRHSELAHLILYCRRRLAEGDAWSEVERDTLGRRVSRRFSVLRQLFRAGTLDGVVLISNSFLVQCLAENGLISAVPV